MKIFKQTFFLTTLIIAALFLSSCSKDDDGNASSNPSVTIEDGFISFDVSGFEDASMEGNIVYYLNNQYDIKYFNISSDEAIVYNDQMWRIRFEQNSNEDISLPEPGDYPIVQGLDSTYDQNSFNVSISMFTDTMTDTGTTFGGNNGAIDGTLKIVSNTDNIVKGTFSFEAYTSEGEKITVTNGQFAAPKNTW